ncbi:MAG: hypothetical protein QM503_01395 [Bacteroidota bacterium]
MKTLILTLSLTLLSIFSFAQFPQSDIPDSCCYIADDIRVAIFKDNNSMINVKIAKIPGEVIKIRVKEDGKVLYQQRIKKHAKTDLQYDINQFPVGVYVFEIVKDKEVIFSKIIEKGNTVTSYAMRNTN